MSEVIFKSIYFSFTDTGIEQAFLSVVNIQTDEFFSGLQTRRVWLSIRRLTRSGGSAAVLLFRCFPEYRIF